MRNSLRSGMLIMFCAALQLVCSMKGTAQTGYAFAKQHVHLTKTIYTNSGEVYQPLYSVLKELNQSKGVYFLYSDMGLGEIKVNPVGDNMASIEKILDQVLQNTGLKYKKVSSNTFVILPVKEYPKEKNGLSAEPLIQGAQTEQKLATASAVFDIITGKVTGADNKPLSGVSVTVKGTTKGTLTNAAGEFSIEANRGDVLVFSSVGFEAYEITVTDTHLPVTLRESQSQLNEVVVTALGIQRKSKSLTYSTQRLSGEEVSRVKDANVINGLAGKAAGVQITRSASGIGGSARVVVRGNKSTRENQPLYVIDGIPMPNFSPEQPTDVWGQSSGSGSGGRDAGDGISNLNSEDIESVTILKGASAAALYGSQAANGAILITTKKGKTGQARVDFTSNFTMDKVFVKPEMQYRYGQTTAPTSTTTGTAESWGAKTVVPDHVSDFFQTGNTWINSISLSGGNPMAQSYFSYSNTYNKGIIPTSTFKRNTLNFRETLKMLNDKLTLDGSVTAIAQNAHNRAVSGLYNNPLTGLYLFPRGLNFADYKNNYEYLSPVRNTALQNWWNINSDKGWVGDDNQQNPYWALYRNIREDSRQRGLASLSAKYQFLDWFSVQARGSFDKSYDQYELMSYAGTQSVLAAANGRYTLEKTFNTQLYGDVIATATRTLGTDISLTANLGASILDLKGNDRVFFDTDPNEGQGLEYANKFVITNIRPTALIANGGIDRKQTQSAFASAQLGLKDYLFLDLTGRNDWSSTFAFTPTKSKGYFYYSAGLTGVISEMTRLPEAVSFAKLRVSYAKVGNDIPSYISNPAPYRLSTTNGTVQLIKNTKVPLPGVFLKPEDNRSFEAGAEIRFLQNRFGIDFTWYRNNNYDQYIEIPAPLGSGYSSYYLNLGNIQNTGIEAMVTIVPYTSKTLDWTSTFNVSSNKNKVIQLSDPNVPGAEAGTSFVLTGFGVNMFGSYIKEGGSWGDIYGNKVFVRDTKGSIVVDADGVPTTINSAGELLGNPNPKWNVGWNNSFTFNRLNLSFLIDGRFGGKVMSVTQAVLDRAGVSEASAAARDNGGVQVAGVTSTGQNFSGLVDAQKYYSAIGGRAGLGSAYIYDATNIRLREVALGYRIPFTSKSVKEARISLIGRNLFFFKKEAPFDPELSMSTGNGLQGVDVFGLPATRSMGVNLKFVF
jgi:TonB-linked SusC/RagA family outer membrane protein